MVRHAVRRGDHPEAMFDVQDFEARRWLRWAVDRSQGWALTDAELLARLDVRLAGREREETLREIERRVVIWEPALIDELCVSLSGLERRHRTPGRDAQSIDRLLHRLLHRIEPARPLAGTCVESNRRARRQAGWRYFRRYGCDAAVEAVLGEQLGRNPLPELVRVATRAPDVLRQVPLTPLLERIDEFYWRGRVIETLLGAAADADVLPLAACWPAEVIFGIRRAGRRDLVPLVARLLEEHPEDPDVISGAIQTFGIFGQTEEMLRAAEIGRLVLDQIERRVAERFGIARAVVSESLS
jgi:hypothetical protein